MTSSPSVCWRSRRAGWAEVAIGGHTCAITTTGTLWCWGANDSGQLGNATAGTPPVLTPSTPLAGTWLHVALAQDDADADQLTRPARPLSG